MNDTQIENWRRVLLGMVGPYALIMPREQIIALRDRLQSKVAAEQSVQADEALCADCGKSPAMEGCTVCAECGL